jgi:hypothetical protein
MRRADVGALLIGYMTPMAIVPVLGMSLVSGPSPICVTLKLY